MELHIVYRKVFQILQEKQIKVHRVYIGEYFTSLEMGGYSITLTKTDSEMRRLFDAPAQAPLFAQMK